MYFVKYGAKYIHDPRYIEYSIYDTSLTMDDSSSPIFNFTISPSNPMYDKIEDLDINNPITLLDGDKVIFIGYVYSISKNFYMEKAIECHGMQDFLYDSVTRPYSTYNSHLYLEEAPNRIDDFFNWLIDNHNKQVDESKRFTVGINQGGYLDSAYIAIDNPAYSTTMDEIKAVITDNYGHIRMRIENDVKYIDLLSEWMDVNTQLLEFGVNLTDYSKTDDMTPIRTFIVPNGANMSSTDYYYDQGYYETEDTQYNPDKTYYTASYEDYKLCEHTIEFDPLLTYYTFDKSKCRYFVTSDTTPDPSKEYYTFDSDSQKYRSAGSIEEFHSGTTYYEYIDGYEIVPENAAFDSNVDYYVRPIRFSEVSDITAFVSGITYYEYIEYYDESSKLLTINNYPDGYLDDRYYKSGDMIYDIEGVNKYGWIGMNFNINEAYTKEELVILAISELSNNTTITTIELSGVDMSLINPNMKPIAIGEYIRVKSIPHRIDRYLICRNIDINILDPSSSKYTLGDTISSFTDQQKLRTEELNLRINTVYSEASAISKEAKEAAKLAEQALNQNGDIIYNLSTTSPYTYIRYSKYSDGHDFVENPTSETEYIGIYSGSKVNAPTEPNNYIWSKYKGDPGAAGNGINSITYTYMTTTTESKPSESSTKWSSDIPSVSSTNKYLWQKEVIDFTDPTVPDKTTVVLLAVYGDAGTSVDILSTTIKYSASNNGQTPPSQESSWSLEIPEVQNGQYLWTRTSVVYTNDKSTLSYSVAYKGTNGEDGLNALQTTHNYTSTHTSIGEKLNVPFSDFNRSPIAGDVFSVMDGDSNYGTWKVLSVTSTNARIELQSYVSTRGLQGVQGIPGPQGTSDYFHIKYAPVANPTDAQMSETPNVYIGTYVDKNKDDSQHASDYNWYRFQGMNGEKGIPGDPGIDGKTQYLHIKYSNDGGKTFTGHGGEDPGEYMGTYVDFTESDSSDISKYSWNKVKGEDGEDGEDGKNGLSIINITTAPSTYTTTTGGFIPSFRIALSTVLEQGNVDEVRVGDQLKYSYYTYPVGYVDDSFVYLGPRVSIRGATGATGAAGVGISSVDVMYYQSTSATELSGGSWVTTAPAWVDGKYIWSKTITTKTDGTTNESTPACITGQKGLTGNAGTSVTSIIEQFYDSTSKEQPTGSTSGWVETPPTWTPGHYIWTRSKITFSNPTSIEYTEPMCDSSWEAVNEIQIGGRNLLLNTNDPVDKYTAMTDPKLIRLMGTTGTPVCYARIQTGNVYSPAEHGLRVSMGPSTNNYVAYFINGYDATHQQGFGCLEKGESYILSFDWSAKLYSGPVKLTSDQNLSFAIYSDDRTTGTSRSVFSEYFGTIPISDFGNVVSGHSEIKFTLPNTSTMSYVYFRITHSAWNSGTTIYHLEGDYLELRNMKLEKGNKVTEWSPAPEDINDALKARISEVDVEYYLSTSTSSPVGGSWVTTAPAWVDGKYMWSRTKVVSGDGTITYNPSENGTCIAGATGATGLNGLSIINITTAPSTYTTTTGGFTPSYRIALSTVKTQGKVTDVRIGDQLKYSYYTYPVGYVDNSYVYLGPRVSIRGSTGATGDGISSIVEKYCLSNSDTEIPGDEDFVLIDPPEYEKGKYIWSCSVVTYTSGTITYVGQSCLNQSIAEGIVDDVQVGGTNLIKGTLKWDRDAFTIIPNNINGNISNSSGEYVLTVTGSGTSPSSAYVEVKPEQELTISIDICSEVSHIESSTSPIIYEFLNSAGTKITSVYSNIKGTINTLWTRYTDTFIVPNNSNIKYVVIGFRSTTAYKNSFKKLKVEYGNKATDWSLSPHDPPDDTYDLTGIDNLMRYPYYYCNANFPNIIHKRDGYEEWTNEGIEYRIYNDGTISLNGTSSAVQNFYIHDSAREDYLLEPGTYTLSGCPYGGSGDTYSLWGAYVKSDDTIVEIPNDFGWGSTFTIDDTAPVHVGIIIHVYANAVANNVIFKPMIEKGMFRHNYFAYEQSMSGMYSEITKTSNKINFLVAGNGSSSEFSITDSAITAIAKKIKITGDMIVDGTIKANSIDTDDLFSKNITATGTISGLTLKGTYIETSSGKIGDLTIEGSNIRYGVFTNTRDGSAVFGMGTYGTNWAFWAGNGRFSVNNAGYLYAQSGSIGGWTINPSQLTNGQLHLTANSIYTTPASEDQGFTAGFNVNYGLCIKCNNSYFKLSGYTSSGGFTPNWIPINTNPFI